MIYLAVSGTSCVWAKGDSPGEALENLRRFGSIKSADLYETRDSGAYVDNQGWFVYRSFEDRPKKIAVLHRGDWKVL